jgi:electron transfer flavoprotein alpha subunit
MANVLVVIELSDGKALPVCLETLGQGRRVSTHLGATLYAVVPMAHAPSYGEDDLIAQLAQHGADKVVLVTDESLGGASDTMRWGTHGAAIAMVCDMLPPSLLLFGATPGGREVAPRAAARMGAAFLAEAWLEVRNDQLALWEGSGAEARALDGELEFSVVATVPAGRYTQAHGDDEAEVEVVATSGRAADFDELGWEADPQGSALVVAGEAQTGAAKPLAEALGVAVAPRPVPSRLVISLGPSLDGVRAQARVALGEVAGADYQLAGDPTELAKKLAEAVNTPTDSATSKEGA